MLFLFEEFSKVFETIEQEKTEHIFFTNGLVNVAVPDIILLYKIQCVSHSTTILIDLAVAGDMLTLCQIHID